jgi:hypothetical protein
MLSNQRQKAGNSMKDSPLNVNMKVIFFKKNGMEFVEYQQNHLK